MRQPPDVSPLRLGRYGNLHRVSLVQNRPDIVRELGHEKLLQRCRDVNVDAEAMYKLVRKEGASHEQADEIVLTEPVLVPDLETERAVRDGYTD